MNSTTGAEISPIPHYPLVADEPTINRELFENIARELYGVPFDQLSEPLQSAVVLEAEGRVNRDRGTPDMHDETHQTKAPRQA